MSTVIEALQWRYATKKFDPDAHLSRNQIGLIEEAFNLTATSYGLQPVRLLIIADAAIKKQLHELSMNQQQVVDASHVLVFCIERSINKAYINTYFDAVSTTRNTPDEVLQPYRDYLADHFTNASVTDTRAWATKQAYLAMGNLLTVCALEGIDACPMEGFDPNAYDRLLKLEDKGLMSVLVMPIGKRAQDDVFASMKKVRKATDAIILHL